MKTLLFLNGTENWQTGIEDGFSSLVKSGEITELNWFYFEDYAKKYSTEKSVSKIIELANKNLPELIVFFHIAKFPITKEIVNELKSLRTKPIIIYDEGDMYGGIAKPVTKSMKIMFRNCDIVSIRGLGKWANYIRKYNKNIIYTPHHADIARFDKDDLRSKKHEIEIILIGNKIKPRLLSFIRRLPGALNREKLIFALGKAFDNRFNVYGHGWDKSSYYKGPVDFQKQIDYYKKSLITVAYEHYPEIPYYFSNRLPIALLSGSIYICHYHKGYEKIFKEGEFMFFFKKNREAIDIVNYILSLSSEELLERSKKAREFALKNLTPEVVWRNFFNNSLKLLKK